MPVFDLVAQGKAVHRLDEHLGDEEVQMPPLEQVQRFLPRGGILDLVPRGLVEYLERFAQSLFPVHHENIHELAILTCPGGSAGPGRS